MTLITVFTPTFNRATTLPGVYRSLCAQTFRDFEWLIIDDGSGDGTGDLVRSWVEQGVLDIHYEWGPNGGKHRAFNRALQLARGSIFLVFDSDDRCTPSALQVFVDEWEQLPPAERTGFVGVTALCAGQDGRVLGDYFPQERLDSTPQFTTEKLRVRGDKWGFQRTDILRQFPYPEFEGEKFIPEGVVWNRIGQHYKTRYVNRVLKVVEYRADGLTGDGLSTRLGSPVGTALCYLESAVFSQSLPARVRHWANYWRFRLHAGSPVPASVEPRGQDRVLRAASWPLGCLAWLSDGVRVRGAGS